MDRTEDDAPAAAGTGEAPGAENATAGAPAAAAEAITATELTQALRFDHYMAMQTKARVMELSAGFNALLETLAAQGLLPFELYEKRRNGALQREQSRAQGEALVLIDATPDKYQLEQLPEIDCEARLLLCKARCCTLTFALSAQDLDEGIVRWDYSRPYQIRRRGDGYCAHNAPGTCQCSVYQNRPSVCRTYDCRNDNRIWVDFEKRIPVAEEAPKGEGG